MSSSASASLARTAIVLLLMAGSAVGGYAYRSHEVAVTVPAGIVRVAGAVEAARGSIHARRDGRLAELLVAIGDTVVAGQVVARFDDRVAQAQRQAASVQLAMQRQERALVTADIARLEGEKILAGAQYELTELQVRAGRAEAAALDRDHDRMREAAAAANAARDRLAGIDTRLAELESRVAGLAQAAAESDIISRQPGQVVDLPVPGGALVSAGQVVVTLQDPGRLFMPLPAGLVAANRAPAGAAARILLGGDPDGDDTTLVEAIVGTAPTDSGAPGAPALLLLTDGRRLQPTAEAVGFIRLTATTRWPPAVRR